MRRLNYLLSYRACCIEFRMCVSPLLLIGRHLAGMEGAVHASNVRCAKAKQSSKRRGQVYLQPSATTCREHPKQLSPWCFHHSQGQNNMPESPRKLWAAEIDGVSTCRHHTRQAHRIAQGCCVERAVSTCRCSSKGGH